MDTLKVMILVMKKLGRNNPLFTYFIEYDSITIKCHTLDQIDKPPLVINSSTTDASVAIDNWIATI